MPQRQVVEHSRSLDIVLEVGIAVGIAAVAIAGRFFYAAAATASWMPSSGSLKQWMWVFLAFGFGVTYFYLAYSSRRLGRLVADKPQLQRLMTFDLAAVN